MLIHDFVNLQSKETFISYTELLVLLDNDVDYNPLLSQATSMTTQYWTVNPGDKINYITKKTHDG